MGKIDWAAKLSSRKFWLAICGFIGGILTALKMDDQSVTQITGIIMAGASVLAYIIGEAWTDAAGAQATVYTEAAADVIAQQQLSVQKEPPDDPMEDDCR